MNIEQHIISEFAEFNPEKIILFGSYANGKWDEESDIDVMIVYQTKKKFMDRLEELYMKWNLPKAADILAYTPDEFREMLKDNYFVKTAVREGRVIYERS